MKKPRNRAVLCLHDDHPGHKSPRNEIKVGGYKRHIVADGDALIEAGTNLEAIPFGPFEKNVTVTHLGIWIQPRSFFRRLWRRIRGKPSHVFVGATRLPGTEKT